MSPVTSPSPSPSGESDSSSPSSEASDKDYCTASESSWASGSTATTDGEVDDAVPQV